MDLIVSLSSQPLVYLIVGSAPRSVHDADDLKEPEEEDEEEVEAKTSHEQPDWINAWSSTLQSKVLLPLSHSS